MKIRADAGTSSVLDKRDPFRYRTEMMNAGMPPIGFDTDAV
jgi:hypothetical protein